MRLRRLLVPRFSNACRKTVTPYSGRAPALAQHTLSVITQCIFLGERYINHRQRWSLAVIRTDEKVRDDHIANVSSIKVFQELLTQTRNRCAQISPLRSGPAHTTNTAPRQPPTLPMRPNNNVRRFMAKLLSIGLAISPDLMQPPRLDFIYCCDEPALSLIRPSLSGLTLKRGATWRANARGFTT